MYEAEKDVIVYNGERTLIDAPFGKRIGSCAPLVPFDDPRIVENKRGTVRLGTRGYTATWEIKNGRLYLIELSDRFRLGGGELFADWFSGSLVFPICGVVGEPATFGGLIDGFDMRFQKEAEATVENGMVIRLEIRNLTF